MFFVVEAIKDYDIFMDLNAVIFKILIPFLLAFIISGLIGLERQNIGKAAGISAHILVSVSAVGIAVLQRLIFDNQMQIVLQGYDVRPEGQRIIAQVLTGVGFIGAGVILKDKDSVIRGLTTAATIWSVAIVGLIIGSGYLFTGTLLGVFIVAFILIRDVLRGINPFIHIDIQKRERKIDDRDDN